MARRGKTIEAPPLGASGDSRPDAEWAFELFGVGEWAVAVRSQVQRGRLVISELRILPRAGAYPATDEVRFGTWSLSQSDLNKLSGGITTAIVANLKLGALFARAIEGHVDTVRQASEAGFEETRYAEYLEAATARPGRAGRSDRHYAMVAQQYVQLVRDGHRAPVQALAALTPEHFAEKTIRTWVGEARKLGLLTDPEPGKAGGQLTEFAHKLLLETED